MTVVLIILAVLLLIALLPVGARLRYEDGTGDLALTAGALRFRLWPKKPPARRKLRREMKKLWKNQERNSKKTKHASSSKSKSSVLQKLKKQKDKKLSFSQFLDLLRVGLQMMGKLPRKLLVRELTLHVTCGGTDAAKAAAQYGYAWAAVGTTLRMLEQRFRIRHRDVGVALDWKEEKTAVALCLDIQMRIGTMLLLALTTAIRIVAILSAKNRSVKNANSR